MLVVYRGLVDPSYQDHDLRDYTSCVSAKKIVSIPELSTGVSHSSVVAPSTRACVSLKFLKFGLSCGFEPFTAYPGGKLGLQVANDLDLFIRDVTAARS